MMLVLAEDPVSRDRLATLEHDLGAEPHDAVLELRVLHESGARQALLERLDLLGDIRLLELRGVVFRILPQIPELARALDRARDLGAQFALHALELALEALPGRSRHHG